MPTLNIGGQRIKVGDEFMSLSPEQQQATVEEIASSLAPQSFDRRSVNPATNQPPGVPAFEPPGVEGYDQQTGEVNPRTSMLNAIPAYAAGAIDGIPVAGPMLTEGMKRLVAAPAPLINGQTSQQAYEAVDRNARDIAEAHPIATTTGNVTGAVAGMLPLMRAAPGAFGLGGGNIGTKIFASGLSGAGLGGADAAVRSGGDTSEIGYGGVSGLVAGAAGPIVGPVVGKGVKAVADKMQLNKIAKSLGMNSQSAKFLRNAAVRDEIDPSTVRQSLAEYGPQGMLMDLGDNMKQLAGGLVTLPSKGQKIIRDAIRTRDGDANWRIRSTMDETLGPSPVPSQIGDRIERNMQGVQPQYREAFRNSQSADTTMIASYLDNEIVNVRGEAQRGLQRIRTMLNRPNSNVLETNPAVLLETRKAVDGMLETVQDSNARNALQTARQAIDDTLTEAAPLVKEADANYAELARQRTGLQRGQTVLASGREAPRPTELADEFQQGALPQGRQIGPSAVPVRLREGARAEMERIVGTNANDRVALQRLVKGEGDWNRARLSTLFGNERAGKIFDLLDRERAFAETSDLVTRNSQTAARQAAQRELEGAAVPGLTARDAYAAGGTAGVLRKGAVDGVDKIAAALAGMKSDTARMQLAEQLVGRGPALEALLAPGRNVPVRQIDKIARALLLSSSTGR